MPVEIRMPQGIDYKEYRFGRSRQLFRGPKPEIKGDYTVCIGGSETYGKFSPTAFPSFLQDETQRTCVNWGASGAGPGFYLKDPVLLEGCSRAKACVITISSAYTTNNRLYSVFERRNERLRTVSDMLQTLFPDVPFGEYRFVVHMLAALQRENPQAYKAVEAEIRSAWLARMKELLSAIETRKVLLWFGEVSPDDPRYAQASDARKLMPSMVNRAMVEELVPHADVYVEYVAPPEVANREGPFERIAGKRGAAVARRFPCRSMHREVAMHLATAIDRIDALPPLSFDPDK